MGDHYSPERRTALVLTGTGADGAYHAGALRALHEAGVKIDLACGRGIGAVGAVFSAVDGGQALWEPTGLWRRPAVSALYRWTWPARLLLALIVALAVVLVSPLSVLFLALVVYPIGLGLGMAGLDAGAQVLDWYAGLLTRLFAPAALPTWLPRLATALVGLFGLVLLAGTYLGWRRKAVRRRSRGRLAWGLLGPALDGTRAARHFTTGLWDLLKGGASVATPAAADLSHRYTELLADNLGQPGFCELLLCTHDLDARRDLVFGLVREPFRRTLFPPPGAFGIRRAEAFDLAGLARGHLIEVIGAALSVPGLTAPALLRFAPETYWRGEVHRLVDRPPCLARLLEEAAAAGAEQVVLVSAAPEPPGPHDLGRPRLEPLGRAGALAASNEAAAVRDAVQHVQHRFRSLYVIRPSHNPVGAFDLRGTYDERSDRHHSLDELMQRGYEDAYRTFIEPVVAASGERLLDPAGRLDP